MREITYKERSYGNTWNHYLLLRKMLDGALKERDEDKKVLSWKHSVRGWDRTIAYLKSDIKTIEDKFPAIKAKYLEGFRKMN